LPGPACARASSTIRAEATVWSIVCCASTVWPCGYDRRRIFYATFLGVMDVGEAKTRFARSDSNSGCRNPLARLSLTFRNAGELGEQLNLSSLLRILIAMK